MSAHLGHGIDAHTLAVYRFDEAGAGDALIDVGGNGYNLASRAGTNTARAGQIDGARDFAFASPNQQSFEGSTTVGNAFRTALAGDFAFEWWSYFRSSTWADFDRHTLLSVDVTFQIPFLLWSVVSSSRVMNLLLPVGMSFVEYESSGSVILDAWNHLEVSLSGTTLTFGLNGGDVGASTISARATTPVDPVVRLGLDGNGSRAHLGLGDDLRVSSVARSTAERLDSYRRGIGYDPPAPKPETYALKRLLPPGKIWALGSNSVLSKWFAGLAEEVSRAKQRALDLVEESDPRTAAESLPEWEKDLGLPDQDIVDIPDTDAKRQLAITQKVVKTGGQDRPYYIQLAAACGYTVTIQENGGQVLRSGRARSGDRVFNVDRAFSWTVVVTAPTGDALTHAELEAVIRRASPAHTVVSFQYL